MPDPHLPRFVIKDNFQKGGRYRDLLTSDILADICKRLTGQPHYAVEFDREGYNVGRLAMLYDGGRSFYVSISEVDIRSRNASFQSFPSALSRFILDPARDKRICFYIHPGATGNFETDYFLFMYRLMKTAGVSLLNIKEHVHHAIAPFAAPEDIVTAKDRLRRQSHGNTSTYVTRGARGEIEVYGKTYGANKYETTLICLALAAISPTGLSLYQIEDGDLRSLPATSLAALRTFPNVSVEMSDVAIETEEFIARNSLRSIRFIYNLLERFEKKRCAFCQCEIPQIVQGAHIWPVASIKRSGLALADQLQHALDGHNGLWLCENHHKLLDAGALYIATNGQLKYSRSLSAPDVVFLRRTTPVTTLAQDVLRPPFLHYLSRRNETLTEHAYACL